MASVEQSTTPEGDALAAIGWMLVAEASAEDPHNPWPRGCRYWHTHNKMWRRDRARQRALMPDIEKPVQATTDPTTPDEVRLRLMLSQRQREIERLRSRVAELEAQLAGIADDMRAAEDRSESR
jgi:hypothetical protein